MDKAFEEWKAFANPILTNLKPVDSNKEIILKLSEEILSKFTKLELLDKYDVYQVLLAYWNETMNDDVLLVIQDELGYKLAKVTDDIKEELKESKKSKKDSAKEKKPKEAKVIGWEGRLIPKQIVLDAFFEAEQKAVGDGLIEPIDNDDGTCLVGNEESKLRGMDGNRRIGDGTSIMAGPFFVCGDSGETFRSLTDEEVTRYMARFAQPEDISPEEVEADMGFMIYPM